MEGYYPTPQADYVTETVSRREDYGDPREETEVIVDENGVSKTVTKRIVTKTVTERRVHHLEDHGRLPRNHSDSRNGYKPSSERDFSNDEKRALLHPRSSESSSDDENQPVGYSYAAYKSPNNQAPRQAQPEKFQAEDYGLEDDRRSDASDVSDGYGLGSGGYRDEGRRSESSQSVESDTHKYDEQLDQLPLTTADTPGDGARAPLAMQETGSRASLDRLGATWKSPTLKEVIAMLSYNMPVVQQNAAAYLQHLCFNDDQIKSEVRKLGGIPPLIKLLDHPNPQVEQNACGALRNLSYGQRNDKNKIEMKNHEGVPAVVRLIRSTEDMDTKEQATGTLWNLSAYPELKGQVLELGLEILTNQVIIPYSEMVARQDGKANNLVMDDVFTNVVGVLRNLSSTDSQDNRRKLRECEGLMRALLVVLKTYKENENINNKATENCLCVLRNLTYKLQDETPNWRDLYFIERPQSAAHQNDVSCFGKKKSKDKSPEVSEDIPETNANAEGSELLWQPENCRLYVALLQDSTRDGVIEASLGALQNLTSGVWQWAVYARTVVRKEKGLPVVIDRLRTDNDQVVRTGAITLTNLAEDEKNKELIGKYAMKDLVYKLPGGIDPSIRLSDITIIAILNTIRILVEKSSENVRNLRDAGGVERITTINNGRDNTRIHARVIKAAGQVLKAVWANKKTQSLLKSDGWNRQHFQPAVTADTLPRNSSLAGRMYEEPRNPPSSSSGRRTGSQDQIELERQQESAAPADEATTKSDSWV